MKKLTKRLLFGGLLLTAASILTIGVINSSKAPIEANADNSNYYNFYFAINDEDLRSDFTGMAYENKTSDAEWAPIGINSMENANKLYQGMTVYSTRIYAPETGIYYLRFYMTGESGKSWLDMATENAWIAPSVFEKKIFVHGQNTWVDISEAEDITYKGKMSFDVSNDPNFNAPGVAWKAAVYFYNDTNNRNSWGDNLVYVAANHGYFEIPYKLTYYPERIILVRYNPDFTEANWKTDPWGVNPSSYGWENSPKWNQSANSVYATSKTHSIAKDNVLYMFDSYMPHFCVFRNVDDPDYQIGYTMSEHKLNTYHNCEYFISLDMQEDTAFIIKDTLFNVTIDSEFTIGEGVEENDFVLGDGRIIAKKEGKYTFFYDIKRQKLHIANPTRAEADNWATSFVNEECTYNKANWSTYASSYAKLSEDARDLFIDVVHESDPNKDLSALGYVAMAVQRYDYVLMLYGRSMYSDFMGRVDDGKVTPKDAISLNSIVNSSTNNTSMVILLASLMTIITISSVIIIRKKER